MNTKLNTRQMIIKDYIKSSLYLNRRQAIFVAESHIRRNAKARNPKIYNDPDFGICGIFHIGKIR